MESTETDPGFTDEEMLYRAFHPDFWYDDETIDYAAFSLNSNGMSVNRQKYSESKSVLKQRMKDWYVAEAPVTAIRGISVIAGDNKTVALDVLNEPKVHAPHCNIWAYKDTVQVKNPTTPLIEQCGKAMSKRFKRVALDNNTEPTNLADSSEPESAGT